MSGRFENLPPPKMTACMLPEAHTVRRAKFIVIPVKTGIHKLLILRNLDSR